jgi:hypothetical protein
MCNASMKDPHPSPQPSPPPLCPAPVSRPSRHPIGPRRVCLPVPAAKPAALPLRRADCLVPNRSPAGLPPSSRGQACRPSAQAGRLRGALSVRGGSCFQFPRPSLPPFGSGGSAAWCPVGPRRVCLPVPAAKPAALPFRRADCVVPCRSAAGLPPSSRGQGRRPSAPLRPAGRLVARRSAAGVASSSPGQACRPSRRPVDRLVLHRSAAGLPSSSRDWVRWRVGLRSRCSRPPLRSAASLGSSRFRGGPGGPQSRRLVCRGAHS